MDYNTFEGTICLIAATIILFCTMVAPEISPILAVLSLLGLSVYYLVIKKSYEYEEHLN